MKEKAQEQMLLVLANKKAVSVDIHIQAPTVILPENFTNLSCDKLYVDLGKFRVISKATPRGVAESEPRFYDEYAVILSEVRTFVSKGAKEVNLISSPVNNLTDMSIRIGCQSLME